MSEISGQLQVAEASGIALRLQRRMYDWRYFAIVTCFAVAAMAGSVAVTFVGEAICPNWYPLFLPAYLAALFTLGIPAMRRVFANLYRSGFAARGQSLTLEQRISIADDALHYDLGLMRSASDWPAVTELFAAGKYWIFLAQGSSLVIPKRYFANEDAERQFIRDGLSHMDDAARVRSAKAVAFAATPSGARSAHHRSRREAVQRSTRKQDGANRARVPQAAPIRTRVRALEGAEA